MSTLTFLSWVQTWSYHEAYILVCCWINC